MGAQARPALSQAELQAEAGRLAAAIADTEEQVAATLELVALQRPLDAGRLHALSARARTQAAVERARAREYRDTGENLASETNQMLAQTEETRAHTIHSALTFAEAEENLAATLERLALRRDGDRLHALAREARKQAARARQWADEHMQYGTGTVKAVQPEQAQAEAASKTT